MTMPGFKADIKDLADIAVADEKLSSESFEKALDLMAILSHSFESNKKKPEEQEEE